MKIGLIGLSTDKTINWGSQATSEGIRYLLKKQYPNAELIQITLPVLPFKKLKLLRRYNENALVKAILSDDLKKVQYYLKKLNMNENIFDGCAHIVFNGEGMIHYKSGHIRVLMGLMYRAKKQGKIVSVINQTVDLNNDNLLEKLLVKVYNTLDFISVREPFSYEYVKKIGIKNVKLIPDAVYGLPKMHQAEIDQRIQKYHLPEKYIAFTGSSFLRQNKQSLGQTRRIIEDLQAYFNMPLVFMANAKTDIWIAHQLKKIFDFTIIEPPVKYQDAIAIIAQAELLVGGRQHPNIFAYIYQVPYIPLKGNTFKNEGVAKLQHYPLLPLPWDIKQEELVTAIETLKEHESLFSIITLDSFNIFPLKD